MNLGIAMTLPHSSPEEWARKHKEMGLSAVVFPLDYKAVTAQIVCKSCKRCRIVNCRGWFVV